MGRARGKAKEELTLMAMFMPKDDECEIWIDSVLLCGMAGEELQTLSIHVASDAMVREHANEKRAT